MEGITSQNIAIMRTAWMHEKAFKYQSFIEILDVALVYSISLEGKPEHLSDSAF